MEPLIQTPRRMLATVCALAAFLGVATAASAAHRTPAGRGHRFSASFAGTGNGQVSGTTASGSATLSGRGRPLGKGSLRGSGHGTFESQTCLTFSGRAVLSGTRGSLRLVTRDAHACAASGGTVVSFSGTASVTGGTGTFAGARGRLSFRGTFDRTGGSVKVSLSGRVRYRA